MAHQINLPSLVHEGKTMFLALANDLALLPGVQVITSLDQRVVSTMEVPNSIRCEQALPDQDGNQFRRLASQADIALVVAPEIGLALKKTAQWLAEVGCQSFGPKPDTLTEASDKLAMARLWQNAGVPCIPTEVWTKESVLPSTRSVLKLSCGAGSWGNRVVTCAAEASAVLDWATSQGLGDVLVQPFMQGVPISVAALVGEKQTLWLEPCAQILATDNSLGYRGGYLPLEPELRKRAHQLGTRALGCWSGLRGWTGLDILLGKNPDGVDDLVVELNPRCTTSYAGLQKLCQNNLVSVWLDVLQGRAASVTWRFGEVKWTNTGKVEVVS